MFRRTTMLSAIIVLTTATLAVSDAQSAVCDTTPGVLQGIIDAAPDGSGIIDGRVKLVDAAVEGYTIIDLEGACFSDQGIIDIRDRYGLWVMDTVLTGTSWRVSDSTFITMSNFEAPDATISSVRTDTFRIEDMSLSIVTATDAVDFMAGKLTVSGPMTFDGITRVSRDRSFVRNSTVDTLTIRGAVDGFTFDNTVLSAAPVLVCEPCSSLRLKSLTYPTADAAPQIDSIADIEVAAGGTTTVDLSATDTDGDPITFSLSETAPGFVSIVNDSSGAQLVLNPQTEDAGLYETVVVLADDGFVTTAITVTITVEGGPVEFTTVGYFGCSNTVRAVDGYHEVGGLKMWPGIGEATDHPYGGNDLAASIEFTSEAWAWFSEQLAASPPDVIWWQMCVKHGTAGPEPTDSEIAQATAVLEHLETLAPGVSIHVSDLNEYEGVVCNRLGRHGPTADDLLADLMATAAGADRGPEMSTLTSGTVERDNCHQNETGQQNDGDLLMAWFG